MILYGRPGIIFPGLLLYGAILDMISLYIFSHKYLMFKFHIKSGFFYTIDAAGEIVKSSIKD